MTKTCLHVNFAKQCSDSVYFFHWCLTLTIVIQIVALSETLPIATKCIIQREIFKATKHIWPKISFNSCCFYYRLLKEVKFPHKILQFFLQVFLKPGLMKQNALLSVLCTVIIKNTVIINFLCTAQHMSVVVCTIEHVSVMCLKLLMHMSRDHCPGLCRVCTENVVYI